RPAATPRQVPRVQLPVQATRPTTWPARQSAVVAGSQQAISSAMLAVAGGPSPGVYHPPTKPWLSPSKFALGDGRVDFHALPELGTLFDDRFQQRKVDHLFLRLLTDIVEFPHALGPAKHEVPLVANINAGWLRLGRCQ